MKSRYKENQKRGRESLDQQREYNSDKRGGNPVQQRREECFRCGREGHVAKDTSCPARKATCHKCKKVGHFEKVCKTRSYPQRSGLNKITTMALRCHATFPFLSVTFHFWVWPSHFWVWPTWFLSVTYPFLSVTYPIFECDLPDFWVWPSHFWVWPTRFLSVTFPILVGRSHSLSFQSYFVFAFINL